MMHSTVNKILIIGPAWVGDMVMAQTLFKLLKLRNPTATIDVLAPAWTSSLLSCMPEVANAIEMPITHGELKLHERYRIAKKLQSHGYDQAIVLMNSFKSALVPWLAKIPKRTGYIGEFRYFLLNDARKLDKTRHPKMIEQYMALGLPADEQLTEPYPYPSFEISKESQQVILSKLKLLSSAERRVARPILAICAGAEFGPSKRWPEEYYAQVAKQKLSEGWDVWLLGSTKEKSITDKINELAGGAAENLAGRTTLAESIALLSLVSGIVTNDSGLMHIGAALNKPLIAIYGSTSPAFTPPLAATAKILKLELDCQPCFERTCPLQHHRCMRELTSAHVLHAMQEWRN